MIKASMQGSSKLKCPLSNLRSTCVLPISVGWDYHEGEYFSSTLNIVVKNFAHCRIVVCDTLQRHSLLFLNPHLDFQFGSYHDYARFLGDQWISRNLSQTEYGSFSFQLNRWDDCLKDPLYQDCQEKVEFLLKTNRHFSDLFKHSATQIFYRLKEHGRFKTHVDIQSFISKSIEYLIEEIAVVLSWESLNETVLLYPKPLGSAVVETLDFFMGDNRKILQPLQMKFRKQNS